MKKTFRPKVKMNNISGNLSKFGKSIQKFFFSVLTSVGHALGSIVRAVMNLVQKIRKKTTSAPAAVRNAAAHGKKISFSGAESFFAFFKGRIPYVAAIAAVIVAVPIVIATASTNSQVAVISKIDLSSQQAVSDDESDLFGFVSEDGQTLGADETATASADASVDPAAAATPEPTEEPLTVFSLGMEDTKVAEIQTRLMDLDYMERDEPTNLYGPMTAQAIEYFQRKNNLEMDGVAGVETQKLLFSDAALHYTVSEGADGPDVESIQERLQELGYPITVTGYFGSDTTKAVSYFQRMNGLTDDGNVGAMTREMLYSEDAEYSLEYWAAKEAEKKSSSGSSKKPSSGSSSSGSSSSGSSGSSNKTSTTITANPGSVSAFIDAAYAMLGTPYVLGGKGPNSVDCSGLVYDCLNASGNSIGYMTSGGWASSGYPTVYSMDELQAGDVVCFSGHVGIYLGGGDMIDASSSQGKVRYCSNIQGSSYWTRNFICGKRPL